MHQSEEMPQLIYMPETILRVKTGQHVKKLNPAAEGKNMHLKIMIKTLNQFLIRERKTVVFLISELHHGVLTRSQLLGQPLPWLLLSFIFPKNIS